MIGYRDRWYCTQKDCKHFGPCDRSLTDEVQKQADAWWGQGPGSAPINKRLGKPECFEEKKEE